jgi:hypothetical protein
MVMLLGSMFILSMGIETKKEDNHQWDVEQEVYLVFWVFMALWLAEMVQSLSASVLAWVVQMWYFTPYDDVDTEVKTDLQPCGVWFGYWTVARYHVGTLAKGSLIRGALRPFHTVLGPFSQGRGKQQNCCLGWYRKYFKRYDKHAYMDVAIYSSDFCPAAQRAQEIMEDEVPAVSALLGVQAIYSALLLGLVAGSTSSACFLMVTHIQCFADEESDAYVDQPGLVAIFVALLGLVVGSSFTVVLDVVATAMLYCFACEHRRLRLWKESNVGVGTDTEESWGMTGDLLSCIGLWDEEEDEASPAVQEQLKYVPKPLKALISDRSKEDGDGAGEEGEDRDDGG